MTVGLRGRVGVEVTRFTYTIGHHKKGEQDIISPMMDEPYYFFPSDVRQGIGYLREKPQPILVTWGETQANLR